MKIFWYRTKSTFRYVLLSLLLMSLLNLLANYQIPTYITLLFAGIFGLFVGIYRVFFDFKILRNWPFIKRLILQLAIIQVFIMATILIARLVLAKYDFPLKSTELIPLFLSKDYISFYIKAQVFSVILLFHMELETILDKEFMYDYISGRYRKPTKESRVMLFMDINNSTTIAEELGDEMYYHFLNDCYSLLNRPVIITNARILKYVGDEVVVSWKNKKGLQADLALEFYDLYKSAIRRESDYFMKRYNTVPEFTTGIHVGEVMAAIVGDIKKQLDLSGDLMNTTSRICSVCKSYHAEVLVSELFYNMLEVDAHKARAESIGEVELKGKKEKTVLYKIGV